MKIVKKILFFIFSALATLVILLALRYIGIDVIQYIIDGLAQLRN